MSKYTLEEVKTPQQVRAFLEMPLIIYKNDPIWVRPLDEDIERRFDPSRNELFEKGEAIRWILRDDSGSVIGRIAAFYDQDQSYSYQEQPTGGCGFFECIDDKVASAILFDASRNWLQERGLEAMDGPINFGDRSDFWGVLVEGFTEPLYCNPYNPPYYQAHFEAYGFENYYNQHTYLRPIESGKLNPVLLEKAERLYATPGYHFEYASSKKLEDYALDFRTIYNKGWAKYTGVKEIDEHHARELLKKLKLIVDVRLLYFAYYEGQPIGFFIMVPDLNTIIKDFNGKFGLWQKLKLIHRLKIQKRVDRAFGLIFGIVPEFQGKGVEGGMIRLFETTVEREKLPYKTLEMAWIGDFNPVMMRVAESYVNATKYKRHVTYRYLFDRKKEFTRAPKLGREKKNKKAETH